MSAQAATASMGGTGATIPCGSVADFVQDTSVDSKYTVPAGLWQLTSWSTEQIGNLSASMQLLVYRPTVTPGAYTVIGKSPLSATFTTGINTFTLTSPITVVGGDLLGFRPGSGNQLCGRTAPSTSRYHIRSGATAATPPETGDTIAMPTLATGGEFNLAATIESLPLRYNPSTSTRAVDTRVGIGAAATPLAARQVLTVQVAGQGGVPSSGALAATLNITTATSNPGFLTAYPCDKPLPSTSSVNPKPGTAVANLANVTLSRTGTVCLYTETSTDLIVDILGWWGTTGIAYNPLTGTRLVDTRPTGKLTAGQVLTVQVAGQGGSPTTGVSAATLNLTSLNSNPGYVTAYPCDQPRPGTSSVNPQTGTAVANLANVTLSASGTICLYTETPTDLIVDILGWWSS